MLKFAKASVVAAVVLAALGASSASQAQQPYPSRPITLMLGSTPGGSADVGARWYADIVSRSLGQRVVVENRAGGGGVIAADAVAHAPADGYTLLFAMNGLHEILPAMQQLPFDSINDFTFITTLMFITNYMVAPSSIPANNLSELAAYGKQKKDGLNFGSTTVAAPSGLMGGLFKLKTGVPLEIVNYRGGPELMADLSTARTDFAVSSFTNFQGPLDDKSVKILAVNAGQRSPRFPNVSTFAEQGFADISAPTWFGLLAPKNVPPAIVARLNDEFVKAAKDPEMQKRATEQDFEMTTMKPDDFKNMATANKQKLGEVVKVLGLKN